MRRATTRELLGTLRVVFSEDWEATDGATEGVVAAGAELGRRRGPDVSRGLRRLLRDALARRDTWIRELAGQALLQSEGARALTIVLESMTHDLGDDMDGLQAIAMDTLAEAGVGALPAVGRLVRSRNVRSRELGAWALGCTGAEAAIPLLLDLSRDRSPRVRAEAASALDEVRAAREGPAREKK
jgi:HEAT repeat protein